MTKSRPEIVQTDNGFSIRYRGRWLYSRTSPRDSAIRRTAGIELKEKTLIFFPSPLFFYGMPELLSRLPEDCHILSVETDQQLMKVSMGHVPEEIRKDSRFSLIRTESKEELVRFLHTLDIRRYRRAQIITAGGGYGLNAETYRRLFHAVQEEIRQFWQNRMTSIHMGYLWLKNLLCNLVEGFSAEPRLNGEDIRKPVCVVGAGESLEHSISLLRELRRDLYILTVDTALPVLEAHGIFPDGICVMESQFANTYDFVGAKSRKAAAILDLTSYPPLYRFFTGGKKIFCSRFAENKLLFRLSEAGFLPESVPPLGSIGVTALYIACRITNMPVFMTGLDFSYTLGKPHARGAPSHTLKLSRCCRLSPPLAYAETVNRPLVRVAGKERSNTEVTSDLVLLSYADSFRSLIRQEQRIYELHPSATPSFGIENGAGHAGSADEVRAVIEKHVESRAPYEGEVEPRTQQGRDLDDSLTRREHLRAFLRHELELLRRAIETGKHYITTSQEKESREAVLGALIEVDYIFLHFPDQQPLPSADVGFVKRAVISGEKFRFIVEKVLGVLG